MKVREAIQIQKDFVARKHHIYKYLNPKLIKSMKVLTMAYDSLWEYLWNNPKVTFDDYLMTHKSKELEKLFKEV